MPRAREKRTIPAICPRPARSDETWGAETWGAETWRAATAGRESCADRRSNVNGMITTVASAAHHTAWRVAAFTRGMNFSASQMISAAARAGATLLSTAVRAVVEK